MEGLLAKPPVGQEWREKPKRAQNGQHLEAMMEHPDCGDNSCMFAEKKGGMRTNGGCQCFDSGKLYGASEEHKKVHTELYRYARRLRNELRERTEPDSDHG